MDNKIWKPTDISEVDMSDEVIGMVLAPIPFTGSEDFLKNQAKNISKKMANNISTSQDIDQIRKQIEKHKTELESLHRMEARISDSIKSLEEHIDLLNRTKFDPESLSGKYIVITDTAVPNKITFFKVENVLTSQSEFYLFGDSITSTTVIAINHEEFVIKAQTKLCIKFEDMDKTNRATKVLGLTVIEDSSKYDYDRILDLAIKQLKQEE